MSTRVIDPAEQDAFDGRAVCRKGHGHDRGCTCPSAYARCKYIVTAEQRLGICQQHGGWGWLGWDNGYQSGPAHRHSIAAPWGDDCDDCGAPVEHEGDGDYRDATGSLWCHDLG